MWWFYASVIGVGLGTVAGWTAERLPAAPIVQSVGASFAALLLGTASMTLVRLRSAKADPRGGVFVGIGLENVFYVGALCASAAVLHVGLGSVTDAIPGLVANRPIVLGTIAGLVGTCAVVYALIALKRSDVLGMEGLE